MRMNSLPVKISLVAAVAIAGVFGIGTYFLAQNAGDVIDQQNKEIQNNIAYNQALDASKKLDVAARVAENIATVSAALKSQGVVDRAVFDQMLKALLEKNGDLLGTWTGWEPNALDGRDSEFANTAGHDATGRYLVYWNRPTDTLVRDVLMDYDKPGVGNYYLLPMQHNRAVAIEPYLYPIAGKDALLSSFSVPIVLNGKTVGIGGVDLSLDNLNVSMQQIKPFGTGFVSLVSSGGVAVTHPNAQAIGKPLADADAPSATAASSSALSAASRPTASCRSTASAPTDSRGASSPRRSRPAARRICGRSWSPFRWPRSRPRSRRRAQPCTRSRVQAF